MVSVEETRGIWYFLFCGRFCNTEDLARHELVAGKAWVERCELVLLQRELALDFGASIIFLNLTQELLL